jgi:hypothetical protein
LDGVFGIGTGEFIMECSSDSWRVCDGLAICCREAWGPSAGFGTALVGIVAGVEGWEMVWLLMDDLRASAVLLGGCEDELRPFVV